MSVAAPRVMITNGGPHPASKWAEVTTSEIISISDSADPTSEEVKASRRLELKILDITEAYHDNVMAMEKAGIDKDGDGRLESPIDGKEHDPQEVIDAIAAAAVGTPHEDHFKKPEVQAAIRSVLLQHTIHVIGIERSWHADRSGTEKAKKWKAAFHNDGMTRAHLAVAPVGKVK